MKTTKIILGVVMAGILFSCTNNNRNGSNMSAEGTVQSNNVNNEMEDDRTAADVDTVVSPGSNAKELKEREPGSSATVDNSNTPPSPTTGTGHDANMAGQTSTHGRKTTEGDK